MRRNDTEYLRLEEFFDLCQDLVCVVGGDGRFLVVNPAVPKALVRDRDAFDDLDFFELVHPEDLGETKLVLASCDAQASFRARVQTGDGSYRTVDWRVHGQRDGRLYLVGRDTTGGADPELATRHAAMLAAIPDIVAEVDRHKIYRWLNQPGLEFFGHDAIGKRVEEFYVHDPSPTFDAVAPLFDGSEETIYVETWQRRQDGEHRLLGWWCKSLKDADGRVTGAISSARDMTEGRRTEDELRDSEQKVQALFQNAAQGIVSVGRDGRIRTSNPMAEAIFGFEPGELSGQSIDVLLPQSLRAGHEGHRKEYFQNPRTRPMGVGLDLLAQRKDGTEIPVEISLSHIETKEGVIAVAFISDITERKRALHEKKTLEQRLEHATKMEAVGRLAGGIAHDFNNLLTALSGFAEIVLDELPEDHMLYQGAKETYKTCQRSASLVRRLLAVSRRQILQPRVMALNDKVDELHKMLSGLLGEDIDLVVKHHTKSSLIKADESQIEQVILNVVVNARDAMPQGGRLLIETANIETDDTFVRQHPDANTGPHVVLTVSDTGEGMSRETLEHIFEPFFTTKERGKGTGLGLATVYGIVTQSGGNVWAYSEPGNGTTFKVYLPRVISPDGAAESDQTPRVQRGSETVLVVEDENTVRLVTVSSLKKAGYRVLEASRGELALRIAEAEDVSIDLLLTDVVMPRLNGPELARRLLSRFPGMRVLYTSGHADDALVHHGLVEEGVAFLEKPFTRDDLMRRVREVLDAPRPTSRR